MNLEQYIEGVVRTDPNTEQYVDAASRMQTLVRMMHFLIGMQTEIGEILDTLKRWVYYGKPWTEDTATNLVEEAGDLSWYYAGFLQDVAMRSGLKPEDIWAKNLAKLQARYPEKFSSEHALNRDVAAELTAAFENHKLGGEQS